jgi:hypothetical protein
MRRSTLSSRGVSRSTLQSGSTKFSNFVIKKNPVNFSHQEGQMSTLQSGKTDVNPVKSQKSKKERKHQVKSLIKLYHKKKKREKPYH